MLVVVRIDYWPRYCVDVLAAEFPKDCRVRWCIGYLTICNMVAVVGASFSEKMKNRKRCGRTYIMWHCKTWTALRRTKKKMRVEERPFIDATPFAPPVKYWYHGGHHTFLILLKEVSRKRALSSFDRLKKPAQYVPFLPFTLKSTFIVRIYCVSPAPTKSY